MSPDKHIVSGIALGTCFFASFKQSSVAVTAAAAAVFCDVDHVLEYGIYCVKNKEKPDINHFLSGHYFEQEGKIFIVFHAYEYLLALFILFLAAMRHGWKVKRYVGAAFAGYALHMGLDTIGNDCTIKGYSICYRARHAWNLCKICKNCNKK